MNLLWCPELVVISDGTINREAIALAVRFAASSGERIGAINRQLAREGRLILIENKDDFRTKIVIARSAEMNPV